MPSEQKGILYALGAFLIWGICPIYFKWLAAVPAGEIAATCTDKGKIPERIHAARVRAVKQALNEPGEQPEQQ